jgi:acetylornithine deacetylase/succinyl-diaminopimelate desuccinylase-like protein
MDRQTATTTAAEAARGAAFDALDRARDEVIGTLSALVGVQSINPNYPHFPGVTGEGGESAANEVLRPVYEAAGCEVDIFEAIAGRANLVGVRRGSGGGRSLILNGHVDTVAPGDPANWTSKNPFDGRVEGGRLYGLGASDQKSGLVAAAWAVRALETAGVRLRGDLTLESVVGEENMEHEAGTTATIKRGYTADAAIVTEPTSFSGPPTLSPCSGGGTVFAITIEGLAAHSCARANHIWPGGTGELHAVNAIDKAFYVAAGLRRLEEQWGLTRRHPLFPSGYFTIGVNTIFGTLHGQDLSWAAANGCRLEYMAMYEPTRTQTDVRIEIEAWLDRLYDADSWLRHHRPSIAWTHTWPPYDTPPDHPIVAAVEGAHVAALGEPVQVQGFAAVDDATWFEKAGIPAITYGPGSILTCHCFDESVPVDDLIRAARVYIATAIDWCGLDESRRN